MAMTFPIDPSTLESPGWRSTWNKILTGTGQGRSKSNRKTRVPVIGVVKLLTGSLGGGVRGEVIQTTVVVLQAIKRIELTSFSVSVIA
jgi:hypothetical protein